MIGKHEGQRARHAPGLARDVFDGAGGGGDAQELLELVHQQLSHLRRGIHHDHAVGRRGGQPALDGRADVRPGKPLAERRVQREPDHLVEALGLGQRADPGPADEHPRAALQLDVTRFFQVLVRGGDGVVVDLEAAGQRAHAGQPLAMGEAAVEDLQLELGDELVADGNTAAAIEDDVQRHPARSLLRGGAVAPRPSFWTHPAPRAK